jgi:hypothetical protein
MAACAPSPGGAQQGRRSTLSTRLAERSPLVCREQRRLTTQLLKLVTAAPAATTISQPVPALARSLSADPQELFTAGEAPLR